MANARTTFRGLHDSFERLLRPELAKTGGNLVLIVGWQMGIKVPISSFMRPLLLEFYVWGPIMSVNVKLAESLVEQARRYAVIQHRSVPKQIEYWSQIGKIAEENPDLPFSMIRDILVADQEEPVGEYVFN